jgi:hypothetical protein
MSFEIGVLEQTGSRKVPMTITRYAGGEDVGSCYQLTALMGNGEVGYVQVTLNDLIMLIHVIKTEFFIEKGN